MLEIDTKNGHYLGIKSSTFTHEAAHFEEEMCRKVGAKVPFRRERGAVWKGRRCRLVGVYPYVPNELHARAICLARACNLFGMGVQSFANFLY